MAIKMRRYMAVVRLVSKLNYIERSGATYALRRYLQARTRNQVSGKAFVLSPPQKCTPRDLREKGSARLVGTYAQLRGALRGTGSVEHVSIAK